MSNFKDHSWRTIESFAIDKRDMFERAYQADPKRTHSELVNNGLWYVATQLKIDHAAGRLG
jgi:hypothetical protein